MNFPFAKKTRICAPERIFEELEPRIVLDASIDSGLHGTAFAHHDLSSQLSHQAASDAACYCDPLASAAECPCHDFNVVLISDKLQDLDMLQKAAVGKAQVIVYDGAKDNLDTINVKLHSMVESEGRKIDHIAVLDHGKTGKIMMGSDTFDMGNLAGHRASFQDLGAMMKEHGQIQFYNCSTAGDDAGKALINSIAEYTHADVFASVNKTGGNHPTQSAAHTPPVVAAAVDDHVAAAASVSDAPPEIPTLDAPNPPVMVTIGPNRLLHLGNCFHVSSADPDREVTVKVTYNPDPAEGAGIALMKVDTPANAAVAVDAPLAGGNTWTIEGTVAGVNEALKTLRGKASIGFEGDAEVTVTVTDSISSSPISSETLIIPLYTQQPSNTADHHDTPAAKPEPKPDPDAGVKTPKPVVTEPEIPAMFQSLPTDGPPVIVAKSDSLTVEGPSPVTIPEVTVFDPGSRYVDMTMKVGHGKLSVPNPLPHSRVEVRGNNGLDEPVIKLAGPFDQLNDTLKQVTYKPVKSYQGSDELLVQVTSRGDFGRNNPAQASVKLGVPIDVNNS